MSTLITPTYLLPLMDATGKIFNILAIPIDQAAQTAGTLLTDLSTAFATTDVAQLVQWVPDASGLTTPRSAAFGATGAPSAFGGSSVGLGSFGSGSGLYNRSSLIGGLNKWFERARLQVRLLAPVGSNIVDLSSYAAYFNGITPNSVLFSPDTATAFFYAYNGSQLDPKSVFAPGGITLGTFQLTGANAGTLTFGAFPMANGANAQLTGASPAVVVAPTTDTYGNLVYLGGTPMPQGFAPTKWKAHVSTTVVGTATLTVHALNQAGVSKTWTVVVDNLTAGAEPTINIGTAASTDRPWGPITAIETVGSATAGVVQFLTVAERTIA